MTTYERYQAAKAIYREMGVDTDAAIEAVKKIPISIHCWQGDDVLGFLTPDVALSGGIQTTGNYPGRARTAEELRRDMDFAMRRWNSPISSPVTSRRGWTGQKSAASG